MVIGANSVQWDLAEKARKLGYWATRPSPSIDGAVGDTSSLEKPHDESTGVSWWSDSLSLVKCRAPAEGNRFFDGFNTLLKRPTKSKGKDKDKANANQSQTPSTSAPLASVSVSDLASVAAAQEQADTMTIEETNSSTTNQSITTTTTTTEQASHLHYLFSPSRFVLSPSGLVENEFPQWHLLSEEDKSSGRWRTTSPVVSPAGPSINGAAVSLPSLDFPRYSILAIDCEMVCSHLLTSQ